MGLDDSLVIPLLVDLPPAAARALVAKGSAVRTDDAGDFMGLRLGLHDVVYVIKRVYPTWDISIVVECVVDSLDRGKCFG